ncbi:hypothetical protein GAPWK_1242 [Gilliamella apicola]|uniref:hypothetical protein n=1 Tax=Gilliamella apicola TaxID=1196095 RepID=UPI00042E263C|nr:hypothetical protein [Gilliamella apicola]AHN25819.1 hypothetical protein GAPWK_1242 [Gilliamella apicola]
MKNLRKEIDSDTNLSTDTLVFCEYNLLFRGLKQISQYSNKQEHSYIASLAS